jgi:hypothetical protein
MAEHFRDPIDNPGSNPDADTRRTGASSNDPHGGHQQPDGEWRGPTPDPVDELAPSGTGELPATRRPVSETAESLAFTDSQVPNVLDELADVDGMGTLDARLAPGFGPDEFARPELEGDPELGIDPNDVAPPDPTTGDGLSHEGMYETGKRRG